MSVKSGNQLKNPIIIRIANQYQVVLLLKKKPRSCRDLARKMSLSNVALKNITDELQKEDIIVSYVKNTAKKGRFPNIFSLNDNLGVFCSVDLSRRDLIVAISDVNDNIIAKSVIKNVLYIDSKTLQEVVTAIKELLKSSEVDNRPLLGICISTPGEFDQQTKDFTYAPRIVDCTNMNFLHYFGDIFNVPISVCNDINLGLLGEYNFGTSIPKEAKSVYYVFLDFVSGSALMFNGDIFVGSRGHAGEPASYKNVEGEYSGRFFTINDVYKEIHDKAKDHPEDSFYSTEVFSFDEVVKRYKDGDKVVAEAVEKAARINAIQLLSVSNLLDLDYICLEGKMLEFGNSYKDLLCRYYREYDANKNLAQITFSTCGTNANLYGAINKSNEVYFLKKFIELANKRTNSINNDVEDFFRSKI